MTLIKFGLLFVSALFSVAAIAEIRDKDWIWAAIQTAIAVFAGVTCAVLWVKI